MNKILIVAILAVSAFGQTRSDTSRGPAYPNDATTGTVLSGTAKQVFAAGTIIKATISDTTIPVYIVTQNAGTTGLGTIARQGTASCTMDATNASGAGNGWIVNSTSVAGQCHVILLPTAPSCGTWVIGWSLSASTQSGQPSQVALSGFPYACPSSGSGTVNSGTAGQVGYYATTGTAISGDADLTDSGSVLAYLGAGGLQIGTSTAAGCGSAAPCISMGQSSTAQTPTAAINTLVPTAAGWSCATGTSPIYPCLPGKPTIIDTTQVTGATGEISHDITACLAYVTANSLPGAVCNAEAELTQTTTEAINSSVANVAIWLPYGQIISFGSGFSWTFSGAHVGLICRVPKACTVVTAAVATSNAITMTGINSAVRGLHIEGGRCGTTACQSTTISGGAQTENELSMQGQSDETSDNLIEDSGHVGINFLNCNYCRSFNDHINRSYEAGIYVDQGSSNTSLNGIIENALCQDCNVGNQSQGQIGLAAPGTSGDVDGWLVKGSTVRDLVFTTGVGNICNGVLTTLATGCKQAFQVTDSVSNTTFIGNFAYNIQNEGFAFSGLGVRAIGNTCDGAGLLGAGVGCMMYSSSESTTTTLGDVAFIGNTAKNSTASAIGYAFSLQAIATGNTTFQNVIFSGNAVDGSVGAGGYLIGLRLNMSGGGAFTLDNVRFANNVITNNVTTPLSLTYTNITGKVRLNGNGLNTTTDTAPTSGDCVKFDSNLQPEADTGAGCAAPLRTIDFKSGTPGGSAISTGVLGYLSIPVACTLTGWYIAVDAGTATVKTLKVASGTAIPTIGSNSISTSGVAIASGTVVQSATLTDFTTTAFAAKDIVAADLTAVSGVGYIDFQLVLSCTQ